jgi:hypothetical protein
MSAGDAESDAGCFMPPTPEQIAALPRCATCGGIYPLDCPPHVTSPGAGHTLATCDEGDCDYCASYVNPPGGDHES